MHAKVYGIKFDCVLIASIFYANAIFLASFFFIHCHESFFIAFVTISRELQRNIVAAGLLQFLL